MKDYKQWLKGAFGWADVDCSCVIWRDTIEWVPEVFFSEPLSDPSGSQSSDPWVGPSTGPVWTAAPCAASETSRFSAPPCKDCKYEPNRAETRAAKTTSQISRCLSPSAQFYWHLNLSVSSKKVWCCNWEWHKCFTTGTSAGAVPRWLLCHRELSSIRHFQPGSAILIPLG